MKKVFYILLVTGFISVTQANGQGHFFSLQYSVGFGTGDMKNFVSSASFRGVALEFRHMVTPKLGVGLEAGWNIFYERRAYDTYTSGAQSFTGVQYRYNNLVPILASADYYFKPGEHINPFVGLGIGTLYADQKTEMGLWSVTNEDWQFALRPEVGVLVNANPDLDIILAGKYVGGFQSSNLAAQTYFTFNIGFVFKN